MNKLTLQAVFVASILVAGLLAFNVGAQTFASEHPPNSNKGPGNNSGEKGCENSEENSNGHSQACEKNPNSEPSPCPEGHIAYIFLGEVFEAEHDLINKFDKASLTACVDENAVDNLPEPPTRGIYLADAISANMGAVVVDDCPASKTIIVSDGVDFDNILVECHGRPFLQVNLAGADGSALSNDSLPTELLIGDWPTAQIGIFGNGYAIASITSIKVILP